MTDRLTDTTVLIARTPTGLIARGGPGVRTARSGEWSLMVDDFGNDEATPRRLADILADASVDALSSVLRHFDDSRYELFALVGPGVVIAGSAPAPSSPFFTGVLVEPKDCVVAVGFVESHAVPEGWLTIPIGTAIAWGDHGPELLCDIRRRWIRPWDQTGSPTSRNIARTAMSVSSSS